jgi:hypothetical protein
MSAAQLNKQLAASCADARDHATRKLQVERATTIALRQQVEDLEFERNQDIQNVVDEMQSEYQQHMANVESVYFRLVAEKMKEKQRYMEIESNLTRKLHAASHKCGEFATENVLVLSLLNMCSLPTPLHIEQRRQGNEIVRIRRQGSFIVREYATCVREHQQHGSGTDASSLTAS